MFSKLKVTQLEKNMPTNNMYVNGEVAEAQKAVLALASRLCTYEPVIELNMEVAATLMAPKVAWELEGLAIRMQEREEEGEVSAIGEWRKAEEVARQEGKNIFITHKEVFTMPRDK